MDNANYLSLIQYLKKLGHVAVAFSGGVDSSLLAYVAAQAFEKNMVAITVKTPYIPAWEIDEAIAFAEKYNFNHQLIELETPANISQNPPDRCYLCKRELFTAIQTQATTLGIPTIIEGSNLDDLSDYRPGMRALKELQILSPLLDVGLTKATIRELSHQLGLPTWDKPAYACLLSRIPYNTEITRAELKRIAAAEMVLRELNISGGRVRSHGDIARIEVPLKNFIDLLQNELRIQLIDKIKLCGYIYVTLDLEGYQTGSLNKTITTDTHHE